MNEPYTKNCYREIRIPHIKHCQYNICLLTNMSQLHLHNRCLDLNNNITCYYKMTNMKEIIIIHCSLCIICDVITQNPVCHSWDGQDERKHCYKLCLSSSCQTMKHDSFYFPGLTIYTYTVDSHVHWANKAVIRCPQQGLWDTTMLKDNAFHLHSFPIWSNQIYPLIFMHEFWIPHHAKTEMFNLLTWGPKLGRSLIPISQLLLYCEYVGLISFPYGSIGHILTLSNMI